MAVLAHIFSEIEGTWAESMKEYLGCDLCVEMLLYENTGGVTACSFRPYVLFSQPDPKKPKTPALRGLPEGFGHAVGKPLVRQDGANELSSVTVPAQHRAG